MSETNPPKGDRVAKLMARAGLCSRRDAERWIVDGRVKVDGQVLDTPAMAVDDPTRIEVDGKPLPQAERGRVWRYHKPPGLITTHKDDQDRPTVFDTLPANLGRVISVGRLDLNSEGLLLLTNDGQLARELELPSTGWVRTYRVRVFGHVTPEMLDALKDGVTVEGVKYGPIDAQIVKATGRNAWLMVSLTEGKNREIRNVMRHLDLHVNRLIRLSYGPFQLGSLERGQVEEVPPGQLLGQVGAKLERAGAVDRKTVNKTGWAKAKAKAKAKPKPKAKSKPKSRPPQHVRNKAGATAPKGKKR